MDYKKHLATVSSFRVPCAVFVFLHHIEGHFGIPASVFPFRKIVVSFFLVLSGYLLYSIYGTRAKDQPVVPFYRKRFARIYPLHITVFLFLMVLFWSTHQIEFAEAPQFFLTKSIAQLTLLQCWYPHPGMVMGTNGVTWTLSVILFCYVIFPFLARCEKWLGVVFVCLVALDIYLVLLVGKMNFETEDFAFSVVHFFPIFRMLEFIAGMLAAQASQFRLPARWGNRRLAMTLIDVAVLIGLFAIWFQVLEVARVGIFAWGDDRMVQRTAFRWFTLVGFAVPACGILIWFSKSNGLVAGGLRSRIMVFLGNVSFAFYLCHCAMIHKVEMWLSPFDLSTTLSVIICFVIVFGVSAVLYWVVEKPLRYLLNGGRSRHARNRSPGEFKSNRQDSMAAWGLILAAILIFSVYQSTWPKRQSIEFQNGLTLRFNTSRNNSDELNINYAWNFAAPTETYLIAHYFDANGNQLKKSGIFRFAKDRIDTRGVRWMKIELDQEIRASRIGIACWQREKGIQQIAPNQVINDRLFAKGTHFEIWNAAKNPPPPKRNTNRQTSSLSNGPEPGLATLSPTAIGSTSSAK